MERLLHQTVIGALLPLEDFVIRRRKSKIYHPRSVVAGSIPVGRSLFFISIFYLLTVVISTLRWYFQKRHSTRYSARQARKFQTFFCFLRILYGV